MSEFDFVVHDAVVVVVAAGAAAGEHSLGARTVVDNHGNRDVAAAAAGDTLHREHG